MNTLEKSKISILEYICEHIALFNKFKHVYLFGSVLNPNIYHHDIDILIIYKVYTDEVENTVQSISDELEKANSLPVDLTVLSIEEERDVDFLGKIKPHYLKIK